MITGNQTSKTEAPRPAASGQESARPAVAAQESARPAAVGESQSAITVQAAVGKPKGGRGYIPVEELDRTEDAVTPEEVKRIIREGKEPEKLAMLDAIMDDLQTCMVDIRRNIHAQMRAAANEYCERAGDVLIMLSELLQLLEPGLGEPVTKRDEDMPLGKLCLK